MKLFGQKVCFFFPRCSFQLITERYFVWNISTNEMHGCLFFIFYWIFFSISVLFVRTTNPYLTHKASWVLEACWFRLSLSYGCKSTNKKCWMCIHWKELWNETTTIHPHCQLMVYSCFIYCTSVKDKHLHTKPKPYMEKELPRAQFLF